uniref:AMP-dependent synthetase/ligase domain-containing protein n=3 Tax=Rhizochromulina marina TaxID=1034831 RepID=A0A7S2S8W9_9STRA|mmetsp:Transcript_26818/g.78072  ORF Transcript_26818/g.78072 Transcript_26818/m.78072 type:complete len:700 (+) Transcript_26818:403-2502(+)|eukprot:CAMPEP_0118966808 /NCGR_PEP_ID=MMETSP1173-20130426/4253_1 /TAXON_ID=1034831 /ORGANISM="Rhizochromulina marina cf, Strain CCMP1243" /LENGTH=699 /DNA_ID=CAMNT_0006915667 /DNA_START=447 /DNA_END=2546 /DNA_ORIENTATION=+
MYEALLVAFARYSALPCMGTREFQGMVHGDGKHQVKVFGETTWTTYAETSRMAHDFGAGLRGLGLEPLPEATARSVTEDFKGVEGPHTLLIFAETCAAWTTAALGCMSQSIVVATSYATLGLESVAAVAQETSAAAILCNYEDALRLVGLHTTFPGLRAIIYIREDVQPVLKRPNGCPLELFSFQEVVFQGKKMAPCPPCPPTPRHVGLIMYTSGSTGKPEGVMIKQSALLAAVGGLEDYIREVAPRPTSPGQQEVYLAYLPAAHILEFCAELALLVHGGRLGFSDPKSITSAGARRRRPDGSLNAKPTGHGNYPPGGIQEFAPTILAGVPKIWDIMKKGAEQRVAQGSGAVQSIFAAAFAARNLAIKQGRNTPLLNLVFRSAYTLLGGRVKVAISGGGPLAPEVQSFIRVAFRLPIIQGYGLTETCCNGCIQRYWSTADSEVGPPLRSVEVQLRSTCDASGQPRVLDAGGQAYLPEDRVHLGARCTGRGEVCIRGPSVASGYYMMEEKTREDFDGQGWFHTGDIAVWTLRGTLKIVDRLKNLVKLRGGEYVALESMEATYSQSALVNTRAGGLMCIADGDTDRPVALVQIEGAELQRWAATSAGAAAGMSLDELCHLPSAEQYVLDALNSLGRGKLGKNERLAAVTLLPNSGPPIATGFDSSWTPENQYLTASNKLNRRAILEGLETIVRPLKLKAVR